MEYRFHALSGVPDAEPIITRIYGYTVSGWHEAGKVKVQQEIGGALLLACESTSDLHGVNVQFAFPDATTLRVRITTAGFSGQTGSIDGLGQDA